MQGRRRLLKCGTAMERRMRFPSVEGSGYEGGGGPPPRKYKLSVEAIRMHSEVILSCETKLILQALAVYKMLFELPSSSTTR